MNLKEIYDKDGKRVTAAIVPDGGRIVVAMNFLDHAAIDATQCVIADATSIRHRPGFVVASTVTDTDNERRVALAQRDKVLCDAWRDPPALDQTALDQTASAPLFASPRHNGKTAAHAARDAALENAWRMGGAA